MFVQLADGRIALLTARHVVFPAVLSGEVTMSHAGRGQSFVPSAIKVDSRLDLALLVVPSDVDVGSYLCWAEWAAENKPAVEKGMAIIACGVPGELKGVPDLKTRIIPRVVFFQYYTGVLDPLDQYGLIVCDIDKGAPLLPKTFRGMSGGPAFSVKRQLVGINVSERLTQSVDGRLYVLPRHRFGSLTTPFVPKAGSPSDYVMCNEGRFSMMAESMDAPGESFFVNARVEYFCSQNDPEHPMGRMGRIVCLSLSRERGDLRLPINVESVFYYDGDDEAEKIRAAREEFFFLLQDTRYRLVD
ncbi:serine protease [Corallococcus sp. AB018]|uniref:S1 family peptidase n=1 Tax=Corallococcus sp. AB018 TaxID=2316715 RepID=UPI000F8702E2|nr:serine protease [Corallococcus sp. AB018]